MMRCVTQLIEKTELNEKLNPVRPDRVQFFIQLRFLNELSHAPHHVRHANTKQQRMETQLRDFLSLMFPIFLKKVSAKAVIGANFWYKQDFRFGEAAQKNNVPYIVLFKESLKISETEKKALFDQTKLFFLSRKS